jgi:Arc/MetJ-type ribon-helix-helix transcriptional regulator
MDPIPVRLPEELQHRVDSLAKEMSISRSAVLRLAIQQWLNAVDARGINPMLNEDGSTASSPPRSSVKKSPGKSKKKP